MEKITQPKSLFSRTEEVYFSRGQRKCYRLASECKSCRPEINRRKSICVSRPLIMKQAAKIMPISSVIIYPLEKKFIGTSSSLARGKSSVLLTDSLVTQCICQVVTRTRPPICLSFDFNLQCPLLVPRLSSTTPSNAPMTSAIALSKSSVRIGI